MTIIRLGLLRIFLAGALLACAAFFTSTPVQALGFQDCLENGGQYECTPASYMTYPNWMPRGTEDDGLNGNWDTCHRPSLGPGKFAWYGGYPRGIVQY